MPPTGVEPAAQGLGNDLSSKAIAHHFQLIKYQAVTKVKLDFVCLYWIILGYDGYSLVTVLLRQFHL